jgi:glyoxylase-like metal-dependent hydrolase (beta-lactamase superfamily II)
MQIVPIAALLLTIAGGVAAQSADLPPSRDGFLRQTHKITDHVWLIQRPVSTDAPYEGNSIVFEQRAGLVVVDAGGAPVSGRYIADAIAAISPKPVRYLVYTHYHGDHTLGAGELVRRWPAVTIVSTEATRDDMTGAPMHYIATYSQDYAGAIAAARRNAAAPGVSASMRRGWLEYVETGDSMIDAYRDLKAWPATLTFRDRLTLTDDDVPVDVMFLGRANTDGDAVVRAPKQRVVATGDIVVHPLPYASASYPTEWIGVLERIAALDFAFLVPGHGDVQTDRAYIERVVATLRAVIAQVAPLAHAGATLDDVRKRVDFSALREQWSDGDDWRRFLLDGFFLDAIVSNAYRESRGEPIRQGVDGG